jgi:hypothetical protein
MLTWLREGLVDRLVCPLRPNRSVRTGTPDALWELLC